jgi:hypothetical protein
MWYYYYMPNLYTAKEYLDSVTDLIEVNKKAKEPRLPVAVLVSEGERFDQAFAFRQFQYDPMVVPTIPYTERADKSILEDSDDGNGYVPEHLEYGEVGNLKIKVRSLRMSWAFTLDIAPKVNGDLNGIVVCERRALPVMHARTLYNVIHRTMMEYPDTDVIRLFDTHTYNSIKLNDSSYEDLELITLASLDSDVLSKPLPAGQETTRLSGQCDGTYAMFVPDKSRSKLSELFRKTRMPVDTAIEYAAAKGNLNVRTLTFNAFVRDGRPKEVREGYKYCVQLSSYNRPMQLLGQIMMLKEQMRYVPDASRVFIHIALRGCDKMTYRIIKERADLELMTYKHKVSAFPNRSQVINFVEAPAGYDFYLKMDDDDFYDPLYLSTTVAYHDRLPEDICSVVDGDKCGVAVCMKLTHQDRAILRKDVTGACENTIVFAHPMLSKLVKLADGIRIHTTAGKATDAVPMRTLVNSQLGLNRYWYWRFMSVLAGRDVSTFSVLSYEGEAHATSQSNYGSFAVTAGQGAAEYYCRVFDTVEYLKHSTLNHTRDSFAKYVGIDVAIVTDTPGATTGMYVPMSTKWCSMEVSAAQAIKDIIYSEDGAFVVGFTFCRTDNEYVYESDRGVMVPKFAHTSWKEDDTILDFPEWLLTKIGKPGDEDVLN